VGGHRRSQVLVVRIVEGTSRKLQESTFVAKCYDPRFSPSVHAAEWPGGPEQFCASGKNTESKAYKLLHQLQGIYVPTFYGDYTYQYSTDVQPGRADVILLQVVNDPNLGNLKPQDLSPTEIVALKAAAFTALDQIHLHGVYHRDLNPDNLFWNRGDHVKICDYEDAICGGDRNMDCIRRLVASDRGQLLSILVEYGVKDTRPLPPLSFFGISFHLI
jgi:serine/threonine protein kinase